MAERRMFARTIIDSDAFLDMPTATQCLYFHLGMRADDDGVVNNPKSIMRICGARDDDMNLLIAKKFILVLENQIIVIKHWKINNYIQKDRYKASKYTDLINEKLICDTNGAYTTSDTKCIQDVYEVDTQVSIGKYSIDKCNNTCSKNETFSSGGVSKNELFDMFWNAYPRKIGKQKCINWFIQHKVDTNLVNKMINAINNQKATEQWLKDAGRFIPHPYTWLNRGGWDDEVSTTITSVTDEDWSAL